MIPKITHQFWAGSEMPTEESNWRRNLQRLNPDFTHRLWDEESALQTLKIPQELWSCAKTLSEKSDIVRWFALRDFGGIYADTDVDWYRPLNTLIQCRAFAGLYRDLASGCPGAPLPTIVGTEAGHLITHRCVERLFARKDLELNSGAKWGVVFDIEWSSINYPHMEAPIVILPDSYFYPYTASERYKNGDQNPIPPKNCVSTGAFGAHHWEGSWRNG